MGKHRRLIIYIGIALTAMIIVGCGFKAYRTEEEVASSEAEQAESMALSETTEQDLTGKDIEKIMEETKSEFKSILDNDLETLRNQTVIISKGYQSGTTGEITRSIYFVDPSVAVGYSESDTSDVRHSEMYTSMDGEWVQISLAAGKGVDESEQKLVISAIEPNGFNCVAEELASVEVSTVIEQNDMITLLAKVNNKDCYIYMNTDKQLLGCEMYGADGSGGYIEVYRDTSSEIFIDTYNRLLDTLKQIDNGMTEQLIKTITSKVQIDTEVETTESVDLETKAVETVESSEIVEESIEETSSVAHSVEEESSESSVEESVQTEKPIGPGYVETTEDSDSEKFDGYIRRDSDKPIGTGGTN